MNWFWFFVRDIFSLAGGVLISRPLFCRRSALLWCFAFACECEEGETEIWISGSWLPGLVLWGWGRGRSIQVLKSLQPVVVLRAHSSPVISFRRGLHSGAHARRRSLSPAPTIRKHSVVLLSERPLPGH